MAESRILELLQALNKKSEKLPHGAKYMPEYIESVSKSISHVIYSTIKFRSTSATSKRVDFIQLLQKWGIQESKHFKIDDSNYKCFLRHLAGEDEATSEDDFVEKFFQDVKKEYEQSRPPDFLTEITNFYNELDQQTSENNSFLDEIATSDQEKLEESGFEFNISKTVNNFENIESFLLNILQEDYVKYKNDVASSKVPEKRHTPNYREAQVNAAFGLLNLPDSEEKQKLLMTILKRLKSYEQLEEFEISYLMYLFSKSDILPKHIPIYLLKTFKFIYEKPFIKLCTSILKSHDFNDISQMLQCDADVQRILRYCKDNAEMKGQIRLMLYELFALSSYNNKILTVFNHIE